MRVVISVSTPFVRRLHQAANRKGVSVRQISAALHITDESVRKWFRGTNEPSIERMSDLANILGVSPSWLRFGGAGEAETPGKRLRRVPLISLHGLGSMDNEKTLSGVPVTEAAFAFVMSGDYMEPLIQDGLVCIVDPEVKPDHGDVVVYEMEDGNGICRQLLNEGGEWILLAKDRRLDKVQPVSMEQIKGTVVFVGKIMK